MVDDLWLPLEHPLLQVERGQVTDLVGLVQQRLHDPEEERAPESEKDMVSSFNIPLKGLCRVMEMMYG